MKTFHVRTLALAVLTGVTLIGTGCAVHRGQSTVGAYIDDKAIVASVKTRMIADKSVDAAVINVDSLNGTVSLSGFAKSSAEKAQAGYIARNTNGVREVINNIVVRP